VILKYPVWAGLCEVPEDYHYSSARFYVDGFNGASISLVPYNRTSTITNQNIPQSLKFYKTKEQVILTLY
jgi:hypothetical protein